MNATLKIILVLFGLAYLISPADLIPDLLLPWIGWIDDSLVLWSVYYLIRYGELPWFMFKKKPGPRFPGNSAKPDSRFSGTRQKKKQHGTPDAPPRDPGSGQKTGKKKKPGSSGKTPYDILGVPPDAGWTQIQAAYKEKIKQYHPDKLSHLGEEFSTLANEKFLEIQAAYDTLKQKHN
ncbi:MAG: DnaJ domain-containing protein [Desulfobacterales bacterium]|nr:DnaJ domain-containing protein [Desulfobacterales bacterium]